MHACASPPLPATMRLLPEYPVRAPDRPPLYAHPARLILILSLAPIIGLGIGRFAYALVLPDMREAADAETDDRRQRQNEDQPRGMRDRKSTRLNSRNPNSPYSGF